MERWDLYDKSGNPLGKTLERGKRLRAGEHHLVVHVWILNSAGRLLIQRRAPHLKLMPGAWAATGGSAIAGEDSLTAVRRELREELGVDLPEDRFAKIGRLLRRNSLCDLWLVEHTVAVPALRLQREEVADARFVTPAQLRELVKKGKFHNYGDPYFDLLFEHVEARLKSRAN